MKKYLVLFFVLISALPFNLISAGELLWKKGIGTEMIGSPSIRNGKIIFGVKSGNLFCINDKGDLEWNRDLKSAILSSPVIGRNGSIFVSVFDGYVFKFNGNGKILWQIDTGKKFRSSPLCLKNQVIVISDDGEVISIDIGNGKIRWKKKFQNEFFSSAVYQKGAVLIPLKNNTLLALDKAGEKKWNSGQKGYCFHPRRSLQTVQYI